MKLKELTKEDCEATRQWRNECLESLRTPYLLTKEMQSDFYDSVICNKDSCHRYFGIHTPCTTVDGYMELIGMGGITNIEWENSIGEISLILSSEEKGKGYGAKAVELLLIGAFNQLGLKTVYGECYYCNDAHIFWRNTLSLYDAYFTDLPDRKFWAGKYYGSMYFSVNQEAFGRARNAD